MSSSTKVKLPARHFLLTAKEQHPDAPAIRSRNTHISYATLFDRASSIAGMLKTLGILPGDVVALDDLDPLDFIPIFWACSLAGVIAFPLNTRFPEATLQQILSRAGCRIVISHRKFESTPSFPPTDLFKPGPSSEYSMGRKADAEQAVSLLLTSGSSGASKLVLHSYANHVYSALGANENMPLQAGDGWMVSLPLYHVGGLAILFRTMISGACVFIPDPTLTLAENVQGLKPTHLSLVATQLGRLLEQAHDRFSATSLKALLLGGSSIPPNLIRKAVQAGYPVHFSYGSTEMSSQVTTTAAGEALKPPYHTGQLLRYRDLLISHEGEILLRGETLALGTYQADGITPLTADGWFHSGDVGYVDFKGRLTVTGRMDNQFISGGENIQPEHIEQALLTQGSIGFALVLPQPHPEFGSIPVAYIQCDEMPPSKASLTSYLRKILPGYMVPKSYFLLPKSLFEDDFKVSRAKMITIVNEPNIQLQPLQ